VAGVVVGVPLGAAGVDRPHGLGALQRLDLGLLVHADHDRMLGRVQAQADDVAEFGLMLPVVRA
jgi:hypothetical protein